MIKKSLSEAPKVPHNLDGYIMHSSSTLEVIHLCINPGEVIAQHPNPNDVVVCIISGEVYLNMGDLETRLALFDVAEIEKNANRGFTNKGNTESRLIIMKKL
jgi:quercetin dioxygenase-like cupin family protein